MIELDEKQATKWEELVDQFALDQNFLCLISPEHVVTTFDYQTLKALNERAQNAKGHEEYLSIVQNFPPLRLKAQFHKKDLIILHDNITTILNLYLNCLNKLQTRDELIRIPKNMAEPLYVSSQHLGIKCGMNCNSFYQWVPINDSYKGDDLSFGITDMKLRVYLTQNKYQELLFFGGSIVGSFYIAKIIKMSIQINSIIESTPNDFKAIKQLMEQVICCWQKIIEENQKVVKEFCPIYFTNELRPKLQGFKNIIFEGVDEGKDKIVSSNGGTAGNDPSFQMFEASFGISSHGQYKKMQLLLREGMTKDHIAFIKYLQQNINIRNHLSQANGKEGKELKKVYNRIIKIYGQFLRIHSEFIAKFILEADSSAKKGTAGLVLMKIIKRYENVESQVLPL